VSRRKAAAFGLGCAPAEPALRGNRVRSPLTGAIQASVASPTSSKIPAPVQQAELHAEQIYFGPSEAMHAVRRKVDRAAGLNVPILLLGESGTGKEVLARHIHGLSPWHNGPFVKVNCAAIPGTLLETELFGYQKGAFTGAHAAKPGRIEAAQGGTLFLDEIAELDAALQAKLLHVLQDGAFTRIGDFEERRMDARVICATNRDLPREIETGRFRADLFYRINVIALQLPALRHRRDDIPHLAEYFRRRFNERFRRDAGPLSAAAVQLLQEKEWRGNVRELENSMARYVVLGSEDVFLGDKSERRVGKPSFLAAADGTIPLKRISQQVTRRMEQEVTLKVLQANHWNRRKTAEILKISYRALLYKVRQAGLPPKRPRHKEDPRLGIDATLSDPVS
jgi:two-component system response regulator AtoC